MSVDVDYFFNSDKTFEELLEQINQWSGLNFDLVETEEKLASGQFMSMYINFGTNELENDGELNFKDYKYQIGLKTYANDSLREIQVSVVAFIAILLYSRLRICEGMLVYDVQKVLARYEEKNISEGVKALFDKVSNKFVQVPKQFLR